MDPHLFPLIDAFRASGYAVRIKFNNDTYVVTAVDRDGTSRESCNEDCGTAIRSLAGQLGVAVDDV